MRVFDFLVKNRIQKEPWNEKTLNKKAFYYAYNALGRLQVDGLMEMMKRNSGAEFKRICWSFSFLGFENLARRFRLARRLVCGIRHKLLSLLGLFSKDTYSKCIGDIEKELFESEQLIKDKLVMMADIHFCAIYESHHCEWEGLVDREMDASQRSGNGVIAPRQT